MPWSYCSAVRKHVERTDFFRKETRGKVKPRQAPDRVQSTVVARRKWRAVWHWIKSLDWIQCIVIISVTEIKYHHQELVHFREKSFSVTHLFQCVTTRRHLSITVCTFILKALLFLLKNWFGIQYFIGQWWRMMVFCSSEFSCYFASPVFFEKVCARIPSERTLGPSHLRSSSAPNRGSFFLHFKMAEWRVSSGALIVWYMFHHINDHICWIKARRVNGKT